MSRNKSEPLRNGSGRKLGILGPKRVHFHLQLLKVIRRFYLGVFTLVCLVVWILHLRPVGRVIALKISDQRLNLRRDHQFWMRRGEHQNVRLHGQERILLVFHGVVSAKKDGEVDEN